MREERDRDTESNKEIQADRKTHAHTCMHSCAHTHTQSMVPMWRSEEWVLILYHVGPRDGTQIIRFGGKCFYPLNKVDHTRILFP